MIPWAKREIASLRKLGMHWKADQIAEMSDDEQRQEEQFRRPLERERRREVPKLDRKLTQEIRAAGGDGNIRVVAKYAGKDRRYWVRATVPQVEGGTSDAPYVEGGTVDYAVNDVDVPFLAAWRFDRFEITLVGDSLAFSNVPVNAAGVRPDGLSADAKPHKHKLTRKQAADAYTIAHIDD